MNGHCRQAPDFTSVHLPWQDVDFAFSENHFHFYLSRANFRYQSAQIRKSLDADFMSYLRLLPVSVIFLSKLHDSDIPIYLYLRTGLEFSNTNEADNNQVVKSSRI